MVPNLDMKKALNSFGIKGLEMVPERGIEPPTKSLGNFCSIH